MGIQTVVILQECRRVWGLTSKNVFHRRLEEILKKHRSTKSLLVKRLHCEQRFSLQIKSKISLLFFFVTILKAAKDTCTPKVLCLPTRVDWTLNYWYLPRITQMLVSQILWIAFKSPGSGRCSWFVVSLSAIDSLINPHPHPTQVCLTQKSCDPLKSIVPYRLTAITALSVPVHLGTGLICSIWQQTRSQHLVCQWVRSREMMVDVDCQLAPRGRTRKEDGHAVIMARIYARNIRSDLILTATALILSKE